MLRSTLIALATCATAGCHMHIRGSHIVVDGVELAEKHVETLDVSGWDPSGLEIRSSMGEVEIRAGHGGTFITVTLHEKTLGDARAAYENGRLISRTASGEPSAIGDVVVHSDQPLPALVVVTGMGDIQLHDVAILGKLELDTGMGDLQASRFGNPSSIVATTGMGDVELSHGSCGKLKASSGMGDVEITRIQADVADCSSGMGDVELDDCEFQRLDADTGLGDIECSNTSYEEGDLDTGLGSVRKR